MAKPIAVKGEWTAAELRRLAAAQEAELAAGVESGSDRAVHGVVRWRRVDLQALAAERFGVAHHERMIGKLLKALGFSHASARPRRQAPLPQLARTAPAPAGRPSRRLAERPISTMRRLRAALCVSCGTEFRRSAAGGKAMIGGL